MPSNTATSRIRVFAGWVSAMVTDAKAGGLGLEHAAVNVNSVKQPVVVNTETVSGRRILTKVSVLTRARASG